MLRREGQLASARGGDRLCLGVTGGPPRVRRRGDRLGIQSRRCRGRSRRPYLHQLPHPPTPAPTQPRPYRLKIRRRPAPLRECSVRRGRQRDLYKIDGCNPPTRSRVHGRVAPPHNLDVAIPHHDAREHSDATPAPCSPCSSRQLAVCGYRCGGMHICSTPQPRRKQAEYGGVAICDSPNER
jgi:hypothetical protein